LRVWVHLDLRKADDESLDRAAVAHLAQCVPIGRVLQKGTHPEIPLPLHRQKQLRFVEKSGTRRACGESSTEDGHDASSQDFDRSQHLLMR
jgi:hypothetical protein